MNLQATAAPRSHQELAVRLVRREERACGRELDKELGGPLPAYRDCDPDVARREVTFEYPGNKYDEENYE